MPFRGPPGLTATSPCSAASPPQRTTAVRSAHVAGFVKGWRPRPSSSSVSGRRRSLPWGEMLAVQGARSGCRIEGGPAVHGWRSWAFWRTIFLGRELLADVGELGAFDGRTKSPCRLSRRFADLEMGERTKARIIGGRNGAETAQKTVQRSAFTRFKAEAERRKLCRFD